MGNLERLLIFVVVSRLVLALVAGVEANVRKVEPCDGVTDFLTGCGSAALSVATSLTLGTIPGPNHISMVYLNLFLVVVVNGIAAISIINLARGRSD